MNTICFHNSLHDLDIDTLFVCCQQMQKELDEVLQGAISFNLERFSLPAVVTTNGLLPIARIIIIDSLEMIFSCPEQKAAFVIEGILPEKLASYLLSENIQASELVIICADPNQARESFYPYRILHSSTLLAKDIISAPANKMTPDMVAARCLELADYGIEVTILDQDALFKLGAHALLAVGKGSLMAPKMILMQYRGSQDEPIALVGKGICYDSGGINLKNSHLVEMKWDKAGAGAVIGTMDALSKLKPPVHVVGCIVLAENMPDGNAMKPGDVITSMKGLTIEVVDTDCEGRLALADGMTYVQKTYAPKILIDIGTLTLETFGALGFEYAGLFSPDPELSDALIAAGNRSQEKVWPLPLGNYFARQLSSSCADLKNVGIFRYGGSSAAAEFLRAFVEPGVSWAHIDIAGTAWNVNAPEEGVTAFGVKLLTGYIVENLRCSGSYALLPKKSHCM